MWRICCLVWWIWLEEWMMAVSDDHVEWLRREGGRLRKGAESLEDEGKRAKVVARAERLFAVADALQLARAGVLNADAAGGFRAAVELLRPGALARVHFTSERKMDVEVVALGRYDVVARMWRYAWDAVLSGDC